MTLSGLILTDLLMGPGDESAAEESSIGLADQVPDPPPSIPSSRPHPNRTAELQQFIHPAE
jgi:hypothetical protein